MIQTHLLKAEPPYQIISAAGQVGIQVATLIVTEDKSTEEGYQIDTHSHPVVNYGLKTLVKDSHGFFPFEPNLQPEGAVWNKVEISDVNVIGLAGITKSISLEEFWLLVPCSGDSRIFPPIWDRNTSLVIDRLHAELSKLEISPELSPSEDFDRDEQGNIIVYLSAFIDNDATSPLVNVQLSGFEDDGINDSAFNFPLHDAEKPDDIKITAIYIGLIVGKLARLFMPKTKIVFKDMPLGSSIDQDIKKIADIINHEMNIDNS